MAADKPNHVYTTAQMNAELLAELRAGRRLRCLAFPRQHWRSPRKGV